MIPFHAWLLQLLEGHLLGLIPVDGGQVRGGGGVGREWLRRAQQSMRGRLSSLLGGSRHERQQVHTIRIGEVHKTCALQRRQNLRKQQ